MKAWAFFNCWGARPGCSQNLRLHVCLGLPRHPIGPFASNFQNLLSSTANESYYFSEDILPKRGNATVFILTAVGCVRVGARGKVTLFYFFHSTYKYEFFNPFNQENNS